MVRIIEVHIRRLNQAIIKIIHTREVALIIQGATEVVVMLRVPFIENLSIKIKITKLLKKMEMKRRKKENLTIEAEGLIKRMKVTFREEIEGGLTEGLIEGEEEMRQISKKLEEATIIIEELGEGEEVDIKSKTTKLNINPIMRIINLIKIVKRRKLLMLLLVIS